MVESYTENCGRICDDNDSPFVEDDLLQKGEAVREEWSD
jgi:hypothetical protein